ncbi:MAG: ASKHA domain-containing protein, partial [Deltaproteobacteria bacterium]
RRAGVLIRADCGGKHKCGTCLVLVTPEALAAGLLSPPAAEEKLLLDKRLDASRVRLACLTEVYGDVTVTIPPESRITDAAAFKTRTRQLKALRPAVSRILLSLDSRSGSESPQPWLVRTQGLLARRLPGKRVMGPSLLDLADFARQPGAEDCREVTVTLFQGREVIQLRPGARSEIYGVAVDVGTTSLAVLLCDLSSGGVIAAKSLTNPQINYGEDVNSRISQVQTDPDNLSVLHESLIKGINELIDQSAKEAGIRFDDILDVVVVGNPTMMHFFLGINPFALGRAPFLPLFYGGEEVSAGNLHLHVHDKARVHLPPLLSGYVGSDTLASLMALGPRFFKGTSLLMDIGTNGELVLSQEGVLTATSCATGPAFEGAQIRCGMRASPGAIERVSLDKATGEFHFQVVGGTGQREPDGAFNQDTPHPSLHLAGESKVPEVVLVPPSQSQSGREIVLQQADIRALQLGKAALRAGAEILMKQAGVVRLDRIFLAGAFGSNLDPCDCLNLGMLPPIDPERIEFVGNAAGDGAMMALLNRTVRRQAMKLAGRIRVVDLGSHPDFQQLFIQNMRLSAE